MRSKLIAIHHSVSVLLRPSPCALLHAPCSMRPAPCALLHAPCPMPVLCSPHLSLTLSHFRPKETFPLFRTSDHGRRLGWFSFPGVARSLLSFEHWKGFCDGTAYPGLLMFNPLRGYNRAGLRSPFSVLPFPFFGFPSPFFGFPSPFFGLIISQSLPHPFSVLRFPKWRGNHPGFATPPKEGNIRAWLGLLRFFLRKYFFYEIWFL